VQQQALVKTLEAPITLLAVVVGVLGTILLEELLEVMVAEELVRTMVVQEVPALH
jgi:hypothetical protein